VAKVIAAPRILGLLLLAHARMLLGGEEITTIERGGIRTLRSFDTVLTLDGADPKPWLMTLPLSSTGPLAAMFSRPGGVIFGVVGTLLTFVARDRG
jgi:hypothetical protein